MVLGEIGRAARDPVYRQGPGLDSKRLRVVQACPGLVIASTVSAQIMRR